MYQEVKVKLNWWGFFFVFFAGQVTISSAMQKCLGTQFLKGSPEKKGNAYNSDDESEASQVSILRSVTDGPGTIDAIMAIQASTTILSNCGKRCCLTI